VVDWGYRADDVPVRLFGAWTTLPAGPAILAARSGAPILPVSIHRRPDDTLHVDWSELITVTSSDPAEVQRVTQLVADALGANVGMAPEQWYSFKPMWPATAEEAADLERRARLMQAGTPDPGPA
jgi:KDO2-lipid IV(A) lauroyltransferase